jgi:hypothetical protein
MAILETKKNSEIKQHKCMKKTKNGTKRKISQIFHGKRSEELVAVEIKFYMP